jgi:hypothetical protein
MIGLTPDMTEATVVRHGVLRLRFADGLTGEVDVLDRMRGPVFDEARTREGFARSRSTARRHGGVAGRRRPGARHALRAHPHRHLAGARRRSLTVPHPGDAGRQHPAGYRFSECRSRRSRVGAQFGAQSERK